MIGEDAEYLAQVTNPCKQAYAERCGADFGIITTHPKDGSPGWGKLALYDCLGDKYDRVLFLDCDTLVRPDTPNLFECVPYEKAALMNEGRWFQQERAQAMREGCQLYGINTLQWGGQYYNTGVMLLSRVHRDILRQPAEIKDHFYEQTWLNLQIALQRVDVKEPRFEYNFLPSLSERTGLPMASAYIPHMAGYGMLASRAGAKHILSSWEQTAPDYNYKRRVWIEASGGLGDVIDAEPAVRYMLERIYTPDNSEVRLTTPWPRVFEGYDIPIGLHLVNPFGEETCYKAVTKPPDGDPSWGLLTHVTSNATDFASMHLLHQQLPLSIKTPRLKVLPQDEAEVAALCKGFDLRRAVLIHPGRTWASRTFPQEWWQAVVDGIAAEAPVALFGRTGEIHGVQPVDTPQNGLDLRDRTSMGAMFELIRRAPVLVSNDSSPVHVAGAFNTHIVLIPTCRHPDLVLPVRNGSPYYRAKALYKRLVADDLEMQPCEYYGTHANGAPPRPWDEYLPDTGDVIAAALAALPKGKKT